MSKKHEIISLDHKKAWFEEHDNVPVFKKFTTDLEVNLLLYAKKFFLQKSVVVGQKNFSVKVPEIHEWNNTNSLLTMSFCEGENLECLLCEPTTRAFAIAILQAMLNFILTNNFYWYDFAPRNILVSSDTIYLVDFEKGIDSKISNLKLFLRNHVFEEYSSFLLKDERIFSSNFVYSLYDGEEDILISVEAIKVRRFQALALQLGYTNTLTLSQLLSIQKMIIHAEEPYYSHGQLIFPRMLLVKMLENKATNPNVYQEYAKFIIAQN